jgi:hypothetical protein
VVKRSNKISFAAYAAPTNDMRLAGRSEAISVHELSPRWRAHDR